MAWSTSACSQVTNKDILLSRFISQYMQRYHYTGQQIDDTFSEKAFDDFFENLDGSKRIFIQPDLDRLSQFRTQLDEEFQEGSMVFFEQMFPVYQMRLAKAEKIGEKVLKTALPMHATWSVELSPKKRHFVASEAELVTVWRLLLTDQVQHQYLNLIQAKYSSANLVKNLAKTDPILEQKAREKVLKDFRRWVANAKKEKRQDLVFRYLESLAQVWDPHTDYFPPEEKANFDITMSGTLEGIGAVLKEEDGFVKVSSVVVGGPAWRQGQLKADDVLMKVAQAKGDTVDLAGMRVNEAVTYIRGKKGTKVTLTVRKPHGELVSFTITRDVVVLDDTYAKSSLIQRQGDGHPAIGYIALPGFYHDFNDSGGRTSADDVKVEVKKLKALGVKGIILDLRNNSGGALDDAVRLTGLFIPKGPVVQIRNRADERDVMSDPDPNVVYSGPLIVLVNEWSASASEIVSAALQDYHRALIVGARHTYGKGTVQTMISLDEALPAYVAFMKPLGSLKLTIQKYYRINGDTTQYKGVLADVVLPYTSDSVTVGERTNPKSLKPDTISSAKFTPWSASFNVQILNEKTQVRLQNNPVFSKVGRVATLLKNEQDATEERLDVTQIWTHQDRLRRAQQEINVLANSSLEVKPSGPLPTLKEKNAKQTEWFKATAKDPYLHETVQIMEDLIQQF